MQLSQIPTQVPLPFAANGTKNAIPEASQIGVTPGAASLNDGFPPLTFTPLTAGGVPPSGADFNGILNLLSQNTQWQNAGGFFPYSASFSTAIGGYPKTALLAKASGLGFWLNLEDNNESDPDTGGAGWIAFDPWAIQAGQFTTAKDTGATNAYDIALTPTPAALTPGMMVGVQSVGNTNTGAATLAVNGLSTLPILLPGGIALIGGELVAGYGALLRLNYAGTAWVLLGSLGIDRMLGGAGQSWQNVTTDRAIGTTYYNTTGRPIIVAVTQTTSSATGTTFYIKVNGNQINGPGYVQSGLSGGVSLAVENGASYSFGSSANNSTLNSVFELR